MAETKTTDEVTCSFTLDREMYNLFKSIVVRDGETVKGNLIKHMQDVIDYNTPNEETIEAMEEVEQLMKDPNKKTYASFSELLEEIDD